MQYCYFCKKNSDMIEFVSIVIIIFGVLQIILFFKLWRMTDDVRALLDIQNMNASKEYKFPIKAKINGADVVLYGIKNGKFYSKGSNGFELIFYEYKDLVFD